jgi:hypothetical protein
MKLTLYGGIILSTLIGTTHAKPESIASQIDAVTRQTQLPPALINKLNNTSGSELLQYLTLAIHANTNTLTADQQAALIAIKKQQIKALKDFQVSGISFAGDPNFAFIYNNQNPTFTTLYRDQLGNTKTRTFEASIQSWGTKIAFAINIDCILFTDPNFNFYDTNKRILLGTGIDFSFQPLGLLYVPFLNAPGGMIMVSLTVGFSDGISIVTGGYLQPIAETE